MTESCDSPVEVHITGFAIIMEWPNEDGGFHLFAAAPQIKVILTNLDTEETIARNIAGPNFFTENPDGSISFAGTGTWLRLSNPETGEPGLFWKAGRFDVNVDAGATRRSLGLATSLISVQSLPREALGAGRPTGSSGRTAAVRLAGAYQRGSCHPRPASPRPSWRLRDQV